MKRPKTASKPPRTRRDYILFAAISLAVILLLFICTSIGWFLWQQSHFKAFVSTLSDSTVYAYENNALTAQKDGGTVPLAGETGYQLYSLLTNRPGKPRRQVPQEPPSLTLSYGDVASLELWSVQLEGDTQRETGVLWRFISPEGDRWIYDTDRFGPNTLDKLGQPET